MEVNVGDIRFYRQRWQAVDEIERQELRALSVLDCWKQLNIIVQLGLGLGLERKEDDEELAVFRRWAKLKGSI